MSKAARSFITSCNYSLAKEGLSFLVPQFPLYAFADKLPASDFVSCRIDMPQGDGRSFFFPVSLYPMEGWQEISLKIVFAKMQEQTEIHSVLENYPKDFENMEKFPIYPRVFRTARIEFSGNSWEIWDERWIKLK